jgi:general secretion pathway protein N
MRGENDSGLSGKQKRLAIFGVLMLVALIAVATLPARVVYRFVANRVPELQMRGIKGSLWSGSADQLMFKQTLLGKLNWNTSVVSLLTLSPEAQIQLENGSGTDEISLRTIARYHGGNWQLRSTYVKANAAWLKPALGLPAIDPTGFLAANFSQLELDAHGVPIAANGNVQWLQAGITGAAQASLGSFDITLSNGANQNITGIVQPIGAAPVSVNGTFEIRQRAFRANVRIYSVSNDANINRALAFIGQTYTGADAKANERLLTIQGTIDLGPKP